MNDLQQRLVKMVDKMPAFPSSVSRVLQLTSDINCSPKELVQVIDHDPVMTVKILKLVNSAYFGLARKIISVNQAVVFVGINTIKNLALTIATMGMLPKENRAGMNMTRFLLHSLGSATVAKMLSQRLDVPPLESTDYFVAGLLHDFGKVVFAQFMPSEFERALKRAEKGKMELHLSEMEEVGADHSQLGGMLGEKWQLPADLVTCIREHHAPVSTGKVAMMRDCVIAANEITKFADFGNAGSCVVEAFPEGVAQRFNMEVKELAGSLTNLSEELEKTRIFIRL
ncbi:MAG: HDOD domain-containing protein [Magnetococcales bacterium]|nr:HDOD domain-containing protein [Magnetococcales bacterium]